MKTKELLEARWKLITFVLLALLGSGGNAATYPFTQNTAQEQLANTFNTFVWSHWFATNGPPILGLFAVVMGSGLIANEASKGTIFFLLSKPVSRERILLTKYGVSAGLLLVVSITSSIALAVVSIILGHPQDLLHLLIATGLLWLATLFPLGLALFFSIISPDSLRPVIFSLLITFALTLLPAILPNGLNWSLWHYWSNQDAYQVGNFPLKEYLVCLITALIPLLAALIMFRKKAY